MGKKRKAYFDQSKKGGGGAGDKKAKYMFDTKVKLGPNMSGFMITYNCKYTFCLNEAKKLLQQFSLPETDGAATAVASKSADSDDIEKLIKEELDSINTRDRDFSVLDTGAKYTIFIYLKNVNPNRIVENIFDSIEESKKPLGRYVQRLMPVLKTCKAFLEDIEACLSSTLDEHEAIKACQAETPVPFTYCFMFKASNNASISRDSVFKSAGAYMQGKNKANKVDFDNPEYVLFINIICNICYISFVKNYFKYRKYNLIEMGAKYSLLGAQKPATEPKASAKPEKEPEKESSNEAEEESGKEKASSEEEETSAAVEEVQATA